MKNFIDEVDGNFKAFFTEMPENATDVLKKLSAEEDVFKQSYRRMVSINAWRGDLLGQTLSTDSEEFFREAQNDVLMSHSLARQGSWRVALMSLRSAIENVLFGLYYYEHPVELKQWQTGAHKLGFTDAMAYMVKHPSLAGFTEQQTGIDVLKDEYATLSKAVHGSSTLFRMTKNGHVEGLSVYSKADLGAWATRERETLSGLNCLMVVFFRSHLAGAAHQNLRKALGVVIPAGKHAAMKSLFGVTLRSPHQ